MVMVVVVAAVVVLKPKKYSSCHSFLTNTNRSQYSCLVTAKGQFFHWFKLSPSPV